MRSFDKTSLIVFTMGQRNLRPLWRPSWRSILPWFPLTTYTTWLCKIAPRTHTQAPTNSVCIYTYTVAGWTKVCYPPSNTLSGFVSTMVAVKCGLWSCFFPWTNWNSVHYYTPLMVVVRSPVRLPQSCMLCSLYTWPPHTYLHTHTHTHTHRHTQLEAACMCECPHKRRCSLNFFMFVSK